MEKKIFTKWMLVLFMFLSVNAFASDVTFSIKVPSGTVKVYVAGGFTGWNFVELDATSTSNEFSKTFTDVEVGQWYQFSSGPGEAFYELKSDGTQESFQVPAEHSTLIHYDMSATTNSWGEIYTPDSKSLDIFVTVSGNISEIYLYSNQNGWSFEPMTLIETTSGGGKVFSINTSVSDASSFEYGFSAGPTVGGEWIYQQKAAEYLYSSKGSKQSLADNEFKAIYYPDGGDITIKATMPLSNPPSSGKAYIIGSFNDWEEFKEMTKAEDGTFSYTIPSTSGFTYRIYQDANWGAAEVGENDPTNDLPDREIAFKGTPGQVEEIAVWGWLNNYPLSVGKAVVNDMKVRGGIGSIEIQNLFGKVQIFDISGSAVRSAHVQDFIVFDGLAKGVYLVKSGANAHKTIVR